MVGTKWLESALVEMLFSCCCRWFFPITRPAVHELVRKVTMAEHTATMRYRPPLGVPADLQSAVKKCPNLLRPCGFEIRSKQEYCFLLH